jgi:alpha-galactosidase
LLFTGARLLTAETLWLSSLEFQNFEQEWGTPQKDMSVVKTPLSIAGQRFEHGVGTHAVSRFDITLKGGADRFIASVGINDDKGKGTVEFRIEGDQKELWKSGLMKTGDAARKVDIPLQGIDRLVLEVTNGGDDNRWDHADWADARFEYTSVKPQSYQVPRGEAVILTPKPGPTPRINGPSIFGVHPGSPFLYSIPVTGDRPMRYAVDKLPKGLVLDAATGHITGSMNKRGTYTVTLRAKNEMGKAEKQFRVVVGDQIALTPPMGWNSWNTWGDRVTQENVLSSARALMTTDLCNHGWIYINIDDGWQGVRGGKMNAIQPNAKFPDMKGMSDELHAMGLKFGIYSSPWRGTYAGHIGSSCDNANGTYDYIEAGNHDEFYQMKPTPGAREGAHKLAACSFVKQDVAQWEDWGVDYFKYDWAPIDVPHVEVMSNALKDSGRDVIYSLSNNASFDKAAHYARLSNTWRVGPDITDKWSSIQAIGFNQDKWAPFAGPGHFNDLDIMAIGTVGWGKPRPTGLTPDEQYTHVSLWSLLASPLLIGSDLAALDDFTLGLLTNDEVLEVNQDALGKQATRIAKEGKAEVFAKELEDGSWAVGLFNRDLNPQTVTVSWSALKVAGSHRVRDLWRQKDEGNFPDKFSAKVPPHGVVLIRVF